jgi:hypothetical protein
MNNIEMIIEEQKNKSLIINNLVIELEYVKTLVAQIFGANAQSLPEPEYKNGCIALINLCEKTEVSLREVKSIVPIPVSGSDSLDELEDK